MPASAHNALVSAYPADGAVLDAPPAALGLVFDQPAVALGTQVRVTGPDGAPAADGDPVLLDATVTQPLRPALPAGRYEVLWRVTSADGHPVSGELAFTVSTGPGAVTTAPPAGPRPDTPLDDGTGARTGAEQGSAPAPVVVAGAAALVVLAVLALAGRAAARRRRRSDGQGSSVRQ